MIKLGLKFSKQTIIRLIFKKDISFYLSTSTYSLSENGKEKIIRTHDILTKVGFSPQKKKTKVG